MGHPRATINQNPDSIWPMNSLKSMGRPHHSDTVLHVFKGVTISLYYRKGRGDWEAGFTVPGQKRGRTTGADERQCREAAEEKIREKFDPAAFEARRDHERACELLADFGATLIEVARFYLSQHAKPEFSGTVNEVRVRYLAKLQAKNDKSHFHHYRSSTQCTSRLATEFGDRKISTITLAQLTNLFDELELTRAGRTLRNIHDAVRALFVFARKRGFLIADKLSVAEQMDRPEAGAGKKGIFTSLEMQRLLDTGWGYAMPGAVALAVIGFGSGRSEECCKQDPDESLEHRIWWEDLMWAKKYINIREEVAKTRVDRHAGLPANLKSMLKPLAGTGPIYTGKRLDLAFAAIAAKAGGDVEIQWTAA